MAETVPIPEPAGLPLLGHALSMDKSSPLKSMVKFADEMGPIYRLRFPGRQVIFISSQELVNEVSDERRFRKNANATLTEVRNGVHDGLFTARYGEENWGIAHRVLMPAFGPLPIRTMFEEMHDIATQLALKWARYGPDNYIQVTDDFTRLALDTIALCSMGYRFNSYYSPTMHPFIQAMGDFLSESMARANRVPMPGVIYHSRDSKYHADIEILRTTARGVLEERRRRPSDRKDLLTAMLDGVDPQTGRKMTDESIMDNLITFLVAGHETTSGMLSFAFYQLMTHPDEYRKAQEEVDSVVGKGVITVDHVSKLPRIAAILRETLRINATIPVYTVSSIEDTVIGGKYAVKKDENIALLLAKSQVDPTVFGPDATEFKPERMLDANFERLSREFPNNWKAFGNGTRACIGRPFAWQEALLVMAMLLQNFDFELEGGYQFDIHQTITIKPKGLRMKARLRDGLTPTQLERRLAGLSPGQTAAVPGKTVAPAAAGGADGEPLTILYGSNSGTCEALAQRIATDATSHGFSAKMVASLDTCTDKLPKDQPVVIVTASYEGQPPDNARGFVSWLTGLDKETSPLEGVSYAVFGCGHRDWTQTFHRVPKLVDDTLEEMGAKRLVPLGLADAGGSELFSDFETWADDTFWPALQSKYGTDDAAAAPGIRVAVTKPRSLNLRQEVKEATVVSTATLTKGGEADHTKKHIELRLPEGATYRPGDYLAVLPINPSETVRRAMRLFKLPWDAHLSITADGPTSLPTESSIPAYEVLSSYVELSHPATKKNLLVLAEAADKKEVASELERLAGDAYVEEVSTKRISVLDVLERFASVELPIGAFLSMMPPMRVRQYSISSSPLQNPGHATITFSVLNEPSFSGQGSHIGVATWYLSSLTAGDTLQVAVRPSHASFSIPDDVATTPMLCVAAGTGLAPFRAFMQQRALLKAQGKTLAPALLFFGCRSPDTDDLFADEFAAWEAQGVVTVRRAYSRAQEHSEGCKYVGDRVWREREEVQELWRKGAKVYVCGSKKVSKAVEDIMMKMRQEEKEGESEEAAQDWFSSLRNVRYVTDVFD
ncbi:cytochrome P450 [Stachybotrys elegans]|uniref:Bifunctional cytochrome P450/NADPH--P450 reductase n=1 Tax=Stachybotrys elegans TaxID=80388 RepID=A0A8K0SU72_9HYPO|nr:cytochrome P450 [Stachybotrys elegans]